MKEKDIKYDEIRKKPGYESSCVSDEIGMLEREKRFYEALKERIENKETRNKMSDSNVLKYLELRKKYDNNNNKK